MVVDCFRLQSHVAARHARRLCIGCTAATREDAFLRGHSDTRDIDQLVSRSVLNIRGLRFGSHALNSFLSPNWIDPLPRDPSPRRDAYTSVAAPGLMFMSGVEHWDADSQNIAAIPLHSKTWITARSDLRRKRPAIIIEYSNVIRIIT